MISNIFYLQFPEQYANIELMKDGILPTGGILCHITQKTSSLRG